MEEKGKKKRNLKLPEAKGSSLVDVKTVGNKRGRSSTREEFAINDRQCARRHESFACLLLPSCLVLFHFIRLFAISSCRSFFLFLSFDGHHHYMRASAFNFSDTVPREKMNTQQRRDIPAVIPFLLITEHDCRAVGFRLYYFKYLAE